MTRKVMLQPANPLGGTELPYPYWITEDARVGRQDVWKGKPYSVKRTTPIGEVDVLFEAFWADPRAVEGMSPVFAHEDGSFATYADTTIAHVLVAEHDHSEDEPNVAVPASLYRHLRQAARDLKDLEQARYTETELTVSRADYAKLLDIAIEMTELSSGEKVLVTANELAELRKDSDLLGKLYTGGVDNWDGFDDARARHYTSFPTED